MKSEYRRVGLISTMSPDQTWPQEVVDGVARTHGVVKGVLGKLGFEVLDEAPLLREYGEMLRAGRALRARSIKALVIMVGSWTYANCAAAAALEADVPILVWGDATPGTVGLVGAAITRGGLAELGVHSNLAYGLFDDQGTQRRAKCLLDAACAATSLRGQRLGYAGGRSMGMLTAVCDPNEVRLKFGVEIDSFEQMEVISRAEALDDSRAEPFLHWMHNTFGRILAKEDPLKKQIKMYLALQDLMSEREYDFVGVKCLPDLPALHTTFCLAHAIMGDAQDDLGHKERIVFACEADLNAALTMQILKLLQDGPVGFADLLEFDFATGMFTVVNCGSQPTDFAASPKDVWWEREGVLEFEWKYGGCSPQAVTRAGDITLARLSREAGRYRMLIAPAETVAVSREQFRNLMWERPRSYVKLRCDRHAFLDAVRSNHVHMVFGNWIAELEEVCSILGIKPITIGK